jgi:hypothetical protein
MKMKKNRFLAVVFATQAVGCSALHPVPDTEATIPDRYIQEYAGTLDDKDSTTRQYIDAESSFPVLTLKASKPGASAEAINNYMQAGFSLANLYCSLFFRKLARDQALLDYQKTQISLASGLATGLMGIFSAGSAATGATGAALGFLGASVDNINTSFLLAPKIESLESLVIKAHVSFVDTLNQKDYATFPQAQTLVNRYAGTCTFRGLKDLIDQSVAAAAPVSAGAGVVSISSASTPPKTPHADANTPSTAKPASDTVAGNKPKK